MMHISERLGLVRDVMSRWAFACVSLLFYCCDGLCKLIPWRHDNSSEPVSDCPSSPCSPVFIKTRAWEIFHGVTIITMAGLLHWCDGSCCCAAHVEYERSFLTHRWGHWHRLGIICAVLRWLDGPCLMQWTSAREAVLFTLWFGPDASPLRPKPWPFSRSRVNSLEAHGRRSFLLKELICRWTFDADCRGKSNARRDCALSDTVNSSVF